MSRHVLTPEECARGGKRGQAVHKARKTRHRFKRAESRAGGKAGQATHDAYGTRAQFTDEERKRGAASTVAKGPEYMRALARKGGEATARKRALRKQKQEAGRKGGLAKWRNRAT